jgi:hypothetical protein
MSCKHLGECSVVDESKLSSGYYCGDWREANPVQVVARQQILYKFGSAGLVVLLNKPAVSKEGE